MTRKRQLRLAAHPAAVPWARRVLSQALRDWGLECLSDPALLILSELVTNAVKASGPGSDTGSLPDPGGTDSPIGLTLRVTDTSLMMEVWDACAGAPVVQETDPAAECGRGLVLVDMLGSAWGQEPADGGKVVWCEVELPPAVGAGALP